MIKVNLTILKINYTINRENWFSSPRENVIEKVALLIGNGNYENYDKLRSSEGHVDELETIFRKMDFLVVKRKDLRLSEMKEIIDQFCDLIIEGSYVVVYFSGHGCELGEKYLWPIDIPAENNYDFDDCICHCHILQKVLKQSPKIFFFILDMCLDLPNK